MVIDPSNPQHIVVAWMGYSPTSRITIKVKATFDGGATWSAAASLPHQSASFGSADVSMAFDHLGNIYASYVDYRQSPDSGGVYVSKSVDGGLSWGAAHLVIDAYADGGKRPIDRPWLVISRFTGSLQDTMYITTKPAPWIAPPNRPYFTRSFDNGLTWTPWKYIDTVGYRVGNVIQAPMAAPSVDSAGRFHCLYPTYYPAESIYPRYIMATASSSGLFSYDVAYTVTSGSAIDTLAKSGARLICDPSKKGHYAFFVLQNGSGDLDVYYYETLNGGSSWSAPVRVNNDAVGNGKMQDLVWSDFDEHGNVIAAWRDRRNAPGTGYQQASEIWGAIKWKDSVSFSANYRISDTIVAYDSVYLSGSGNDFMNVAMAQDTMSAVWGDVRTGALNIWFSRRSMSNGSMINVQQLIHEALPVVNIYPNPARDYIIVEGEDLQNISLYDIAGKQIFHQSVKGNRIRIDMSHWPHGNYQAAIQTRQGIVGQKIVIE